MSSGPDTSRIMQKRKARDQKAVGLPGVTVPAGRFASGAPFSLILVGRMWSEAALLGFAYDYEQATRHRIVPELQQDAFGDPA